MRDRYDFGVVVINDVSLDWRLFFLMSETMLMMCD